MALAVCVLFTGVGVGVFTIAAGAVGRLTSAGLEDPIGAGVGLVLECWPALSVGCCGDEATSSGGALIFASSGEGAGWRAASSAAAANTHVTPTKASRPPMRFGDAEAGCSFIDCFTRVVRALGFALLAGSGIFFSESRWSFRSPLSRYLTDAAGFLVFLTGTAILLVNHPGPCVVSEQLMCPRRNVIAGCKRLRDRSSRHKPPLQTHPLTAKDVIARRIVERRPSKDLRPVDKMRDIVGLCLDPRDHAVRALPRTDRG